MQSWTPSGHVRAIGAWPSMSRTRTGALWLHSSSRRLASAAWDDLNREAFKTRRESDKSGATRRMGSLQHADVNSNEGSLAGQSIWDGHTRILPKGRPSDRLPRPPLLRPNDHRNRIKKDKEERRKGRQATYKGQNERTWKQNMGNALFSTLFMENPYARMLATKVRMDSFSKMRMPSSCMIAFHMVAMGSDGDPEPQRNRQALLPLELAAALIPKGKHRAKLTAAERQAVEATADDSVSWAAQGPSSYILGKMAAMKLISVNPEKRVKPLATTMRVLMASNAKAHTEWRSDMPDHVLDGLRKLVARRLRSLAAAKKSPTNPGLIAVPPGGDHTLERLDHVDDVLCVIRLKSTMETADPAMTEVSHAQDVEAAESDANVFAVDKLQSDDSVEKDASMESNLDAIEEGSESINGNLDSGSRASDIDSTSNQTEDLRLQKPRGPACRNASQKHRDRRGAWRNREPIHAKIYKPPPPPASPLTTYFPTVPYRNRRIPVYDLPDLLGSRYLSKTIEGTVFNDCTFVTVSSNNGSSSLQMWLLRLTAYVAQEKNRER